MSNENYPRNLVGYGETPPHANWPNPARIAVQLVINYAEGGENGIRHGDPTSEKFLSEIIGADARQATRHMSMESIYEYGSRAGVWRLLRLFREREVPVTVFGVASAMQRHPDVVEAMLRDGHEICSHGLRWIDYQYVEENVEREHMQRAIEIHKQLTGERPLGWYIGRTSPQTRKLVMEDGGFVYDADDYSDELPFWYTDAGNQQLIVPYTLDANDMRFATPQGFNSGDQFFIYLKDSFDTLYEEGADAPKMMSIGLHCRLVGRPGRFAALKRFVDYAQSHSQVWFARRIEIAGHWQAEHPFPG